MWSNGARGAIREDRVSQRPAGRAPILYDLSFFRSVVSKDIAEFYCRLFRLENHSKTSEIRLKSSRQF